ncbi:MAG: hypothetical protein IJE97_16280 [Thermoguttaceae bacterium]|nr:hypothetical protein [Thermoguttaceae bacterium]MBQ8286379.1 hypothetical protein [Thermoguttaceae bacterium]
MICFNCKSEILPGELFCRCCGAINAPNSNGPGFSQAQQQSGAQYARQTPIQVPNLAAPQTFNAEQPGFGGVGNQQTCRIIINRAKQWFAINPKVKVTVDGVVYAVSDGESMQISVAPGTHTLTFSCGFRTKTVSYRVDAGTLLVNFKWNRIWGTICVWARFI